MIKKILDLVFSVEEAPTTKKFRLQSEKKRKLDL